MYTHVAVYHLTHVILYSLTVDSFLRLTEALQSLPLSIILAMKSWSGLQTVFGRFVSGR